MAARFKPKKHTFASTAAVDLHTILGSPPNDEYGSSVTIRASRSNTSDVFWQDVDGEQGGYLDAQEAASFDLTDKFISTKNVYFKGAVNDIVYITVLG